jgi:integrase
MARHLLTDRQVRNAKPSATPYRLADGDGLYLYVPLSGARAWQYRYRLHGKPQTATLGKVVDMTLAEARTAAQKARQSAADGTHLTTAKRVLHAKRRVDAENTFKAVATDWVAAEAKRIKWSEDYREEVEASLRNHLRNLDPLPLSEVTAPVVAPTLRRLEKKAPDMARKVRQRLRAILDYGVEQGIISGNPLPAVRRGVAIQREHFPAVLDREGVGGILRAADQCDVCRGVKRAHSLIVYCAQRVGEVVAAKWDEFDLDAGNWAIPRARMKRKESARGPHIVPLPSRLLASLRDWRRADGEDAVYVCPAPRDHAQPITREAVEKFYRRTLDLAGKHSPHSWRSAFSTITRDAGKDADAIEAQLDHVVGNKVSAAYDRAHRLDLRRTLMQWYEESLLAARDGATVHSLAHRQSLA